MNEPFRQIVQTLEMFTARLFVADGDVGADTLEEGDNGRDVLTLLQQAQMLLQGPFSVLQDSLSV